MPADPQIIPTLLTLALIRRHYVPGGERTIRRWISSGIFPHPDISIGNVDYWKRETVEAWIDRRSEGPTNEMRRPKGNHVILSCDWKRKMFTAKASGTAVAIFLIACAFAFLIVFLKFCR